MVDPVGAGRVTRVRRWSNYVGAWLSAGLLIAMCFLADPLGSFADRGELTSQSWVWAVGVLVVACGALQLLARPVVEIRGTTWRVINPVKELRFDAAALVGVDKSPWGYPRLRLSDGSHMLVASMEETNLSGYLGTAPMTDRIEDLVQTGREPTTSAVLPVVRARWARPYWGIVPIAAGWLAYVTLVLVHGPLVTP